MTPERKKELLREAAASIIMSRLLILQSKRMVLNSTHRLLRESADNERLLERLERLRTETAIADATYRATILRVGATDSVDYWMVTYSRLISVGGALASKMRKAARMWDIDTTEEVEALDDLVGRWRASMRQSMSEAVA